VVCEMLFPESFYEPRNQMIYSAIRDLSMEERPVDMLTVTGHGWTPATRN
jgi:replicative DNA helicase